MQNKEMEEEVGAEKIYPSEAEFGPSMDAIVAALARGVECFGEAGKREIIDTLRIKTRGKSFERHLDKFPGANKDFVKQALSQMADELEEKS